MKFFAAVFVTLVASASARCMENCNGNGVCGQNDKCTCFKGFQGTSCADRVCAFGNAWVGDHSAYVECSNKGTCDRKTGLCKCQDGFEGKSCSRMACPENCNGHGQCLSQHYFYGTTSAWDAKMIQGCQCDPGYEGNACEQRKCPRGDDAMTVGSGTGHFTQTLVITGGASTTTAFGAASGEVLLTFSDQHTGERYSTAAIDVATISAIAIEEQLTALPNKAIPSCEVTQSATSDSPHTKTFTIKYKDSFTSGTQAGVTVEKVGCLLNGCETAYEGEVLSATALASISITGTAADAESENAVCANRGECDTTSGECKCNDGFKGQACEIQTTYV